MKAYNKIKNLFRLTRLPHTQPASRVLFTQTEDIIYLSEKECAFIYRQNKRIARTLTPDNPLLKNAGTTTHGAWFCNLKQTV